MTRDRFRWSRLAGTPEWIFPWRESDKQAVVPRIAALVVVGTAGMLFFSLFQIRVGLPRQSTLRGASMIYLQDDAQGRALTRKAREGGPFPSRFELSQWQGLPELEAAWVEAGRFRPPRYDPVFQDLPEESATRPLELAARGARYFPPRREVPNGPSPVSVMKVTPRIDPLSGVLPEVTPPFDGAVDREMASASWRFLLQLDPDGSVADCISLEVGHDASAAVLRKWLMRLTFRPTREPETRWVALGLGFTNVFTDGSEPH